MVSSDSKRRLTSTPLGKKLLGRQPNMTKIIWYFVIDFA
jgi:hypothetical protein